MTDLIKKENNAVSTKVGGVGRGFERIDMSKVSMPRAKILQATSPELQDEDYDFKMGDVIHGLLMEKLPEKFIPISIWDSRTMFVPRNANDKKRFFDILGIEPTESMFVCRSLDARVPEKPTLGHANCEDCPYKNFGWDGNEDTKPLCTANINVLALFEGQEMPVVIQFSNTNYKYGKRFRDMALFSGGDLFSRKYKLTTKKEQNDQGVFYTSPVKPAGKANDEEYRLAEELYKQFSGVAIEVEEDTSNEPEQLAFDF